MGNAGGVPGGIDAGPFSPAHTHTKPRRHEEPGQGRFDRSIRL